VPRLEPLGPWGESFGATGHRVIGLPARWHAVLRFGGPTSCPLARRHPLLFQDLPLEVGKRSWEGHRTHLRPAVIAVVQPFHPVGVCLLCPNLGQLVSFFTAGDAFVSRAPPDLNGDAWPSPSQCRNVLPRLDGVLLPWAGFVRSHPPDVCLRVREDGDPFRGRAPP